MTQITDLRIEINHSNGTGERIVLAPQASHDADDNPCYTWQLADGSEHDENQPTWSEAEEGMSIASQLWGLECWDLEIVAGDE